MELGLLYSNFVMDNKDMTLHTTVDGSGVFRDADGQMHCTIRPFRDVDPDIARDPLSTNRRLFDSGEIELFGSMVVAGPTTDVIYILVPDSTTCTVDDISPAYVQHVIGWDQLNIWAPPCPGRTFICLCVKIHSGRHLSQIVTSTGQR